MESSDPRINRWDLPAAGPAQGAEKDAKAEKPFAAYAVFHQKRAQTPFTYVGPVQAPDPEVAFLFAKEQYSRRATCTGLWVVAVQHIVTSPYVGDDESVYQVLALPGLPAASSPEEAFEVFHLKKRGKFHLHAGTVYAADAVAALTQARQQFGDQQPCINVWIIPAGQIRRSAETDQDLWATTEDKKYREPAAYKVLDKITAYKNQLRGI
jgi:ring-1,2-phenylacetyl-CoA epoxidase subunit PaaB